MSRDSFVQGDQPYLNLDERYQQLIQDYVDRTSEADSLRQQLAERDAEIARLREEIAPESGTYFYHDDEIVKGKLVANYDPKGFKYCSVSHVLHAINIVHCFAVGNSKRDEEIKRLREAIKFALRRTHIRQDDREYINFLGVDYLKAALSTHSPVDRGSRLALTEDIELPLCRLEPGKLINMPTVPEGKVLVDRALLEQMISSMSFLKKFGNSPYCHCCNNVIDVVTKELEALRDTKPDTFKNAIQGLYTLGIRKGFPFRNENDD